MITTFQDILTCVFDVCIWALNRTTVNDPRLVFLTFVIVTKRCRDHAEWGEEQEQHALKEVARQKQDPVPQELIETYHAEAAENWNKFYAKNENRFFKDRHWLRIEFPELFQMVEADVSASSVSDIRYCFAFDSARDILTFHAHIYDI